MNAKANPTPVLKYLSAYPEHIQAKVLQLIERNELGTLLAERYPLRHTVQTDKALYDYVMEIKQDYFRNSQALAKVAFDSKIKVIQHALGTHTQISRVQGGKLKSKNEIRIASLFRETPPEFLKMIVTHELVLASYYQ
ncbi:MULTISPECIES: M48 family metallopeptidase [Deefgea]|uniref:Metal-dependent hydrolase n=1 Tax=Deefgea chitinilytica TaxID=570276 RepID=A0ABS2C8T1_9NEIS|nr:MULTISPECIES: M48 family metallopeptidase [Deefgea]MBM5570559.1 metal-dependent hydrolase [Deefgea chitinilytica]MBM9887788.1 M48 family metallopeptidase [Deefgea sp. CFH1-16]